MGKEKTKALVHLIIHKCSADPAKLGQIRLNKTLWFADVHSYQSTGQSITGETYIKRQHGPVPSTMRETLDELEADGLITIRDPEKWSPSRLFTSLQEPDTSLLSETDIETTIRTMQEMLSMSAKDVSRRTHDLIWEMAEMGGEIPLYATLALPGEITADAIAWADELV